MSAGVTSVPQTADRFVRLHVRKRFSLSRWLLGSAILLVCALLIYAVATNAAFEWNTFAQYFAASQIIHGTIVTLELTFISIAVGLVLGCVLAFMGYSRNPVLVALSSSYIWLFRGVPLLVQLLFWYNLAIIVPHLGLSFSSLGVSWHADTNVLISGFTASVLGLGLNEGAYMAEIVRAGIIAVPQGQLEAGLSLGMPHRRAMLSIVLPQTLRVIVPPTGNEFIGLLKTTSLVSVIGGGDLLTQVQYIYGMNFAVIPMLMVASVWYLLLTAISTVGQHYLERALERDREHRVSKAGLVKRLGRNVLHLQRGDDGTD